MSPAASEIPPSIDPLTAFDGLDLNSTLGDLPAHVETIDGGLPARDAHGQFNRRPDLPGLIVTQAGQPVGMLPRGRFLEWMAREFNRDLYLHRPIEYLMEAMHSDTLCLDASDRIELAAEMVVRRPPEQVYDPLVVVHADGRRGIIDIQFVLLALSRIMGFANRRNTQLLDKVGRHTEQLEGALRELRQTEERLVADIRERERTEAELRDQRARLMRQTTALREIAALESVVRSDFDTALRDVVHVVALTLRTDVVAAWLVSGPDGAEESLFEVVRSDNRPLATPVRLSSLPLYRQALQRDLALVVGDVAADIRVAEFLGGQGGSDPVRAIIDVGIRAENRWIGLLRCACSGGPRDWTDDEVAFVKAAATFITLAKISQERKLALQALNDSELRLLQLLETSPVGACVIDYDGCLRFSNPAFRTMFESEDGGIDSLPALYADCAEFAECLADLGAGREPRGRETAFRGGKGDTIWALMSWESSTISASDVIVVWLSDITAMKRVEASLRQAMENAEAATRAKSTFLATMSHEIRTPMNGVLGMIDLLDHAEDGEARRDAVALIRQSAWSLMRIIDDILDFSKIEAGKLTLEQAPFTLAEMLEGVVATIAPIAAKKPIAVAAEIDPFLPSRLVGDAARLRQILFNFLGNAVKFTEAGRVTVRADALEVADHAVKLRLSVKDTGIGLSAEQRSRLFQPFVQADSSTYRRYGGTGLGLSICRLLVQAMNGAIGVDSERGQGSVFWVVLTLPVASPADVSDVPAIAAATPVRADENAPILVADDHPVNREVILHQLAHLGHRAVAVADGVQALAALEGSAFALLLTDRDMPEMDGVELTRRWRMIEAGYGDGRHLPILGLTADVQREELDRCLAAGMDECLTKPIETVELGRRVARWLAAAPSSPPVSRRKPIDLKAFAALVGDDRAVLKHHLDHFVATVDPVVAALRSAIANDAPAETIRSHSHKLKGAAAMVRARTVEALAAKIEAAAKSGDAAASAAGSVQLVSEWDEVRAFVAAMNG